MNFIKLLALFFVLLLIGCTNRPTVHIYAKYLDEPQKAFLSEQLTQKDYQIKFNNLDFPTTVSENTLLYSLFLEQREVINQAKAVVEKAGMTVEYTNALTTGNHWYTKNSIALFLFPKGSKAIGELFRQDLQHTYQAKECGGNYELSLKSDGTYVLLDNNQLAEKRVISKGNWLYRQFPYIELQKFGADYSEFYFEISQETKRDNISEIEFITLNYLNNSQFEKGCQFLYGLRKT